MVQLLADADTAHAAVYPVSDMNGVTTALVAFILVCVVYPSLVKNRPQFYAGFACVVGIILLHTVALMIAPLSVFCAAIGGLLQVGGLLLLFVSAGGLTFKQLAGELGNAYEVIRRGGDKKEVIIPLTGMQPKPRRDAQSTGRIDLEMPTTPSPSSSLSPSPPPSVPLSPPLSPPASAPRSQPKSQASDGGQIPLE